MSTITTKKGDKGATSLFGAKRVSKSHQLIEIIGQIDELQVLLGQLKLQTTSTPARKFCEELQHFLYLIMADLSGAQKLKPDTIKQKLNQIEQEQSTLLSKTAISNKFVLPGVNNLEITAHLLRVRVRAVERLFVKSSIRFPTLKRFFPFLNRLSDYFFIVSQNAQT